MSVHRSVGDPSCGHLQYELRELKEFDPRDRSFELRAASYELGRSNLKAHRFVWGILRAAGCHTTLAQDNGNHGERNDECERRTP